MSDKVNYKSVLEAEKVTIQELPEKIQRKITEYKNLIKHPFSYKKGTQELTPKASQKADDLNDDIIEAIYIVVEDKAEAANADEAEKKRLADEEAARLAAEEKAKQEQLEAERRAVEESRNNRHFTDGFLGW